jgi:hypothetical protein
MERRGRLVWMRIGRNGEAGGEEISSRYYSEYLGNEKTSFGNE